MLRELQPARVVPVMQDWGGPIGMGWATRNPEKLAGLVVLNTAAFVRDPPTRLPWLFKFLVLGKGREAHYRDMIIAIETELAAEVVSEAPLAPPRGGRLSRRVR